MPPADDRVLGLHRLTWLALGVQGALALLAVGWALAIGLTSGEWFGLDAWSGSRAFVTLATTLAAAAPPIAAFFWMRSTQAAPVVRFRDDVRRRLIPLFAETRWIDWLTISLTAGVTEELAFRGALLETFLAIPVDPWNLVLAVAVPSLIFGMLHALNRTYFLATTAAGVYFSFVVLWSGDLWAAALAHFLYDLTVFVVEAPEARRDLETMRAADAKIDSPTEAADTVPSREEPTAVAPTEGEGQ